MSVRSMSEETKKKIAAYRTGKKHSEETKRKIGVKSKGRRCKGDAITYGSLHTWARKAIPKPHLCAICNNRPSTLIGNKTGLYLRDINDWHWLCPSCNVKDGISPKPIFEKVKGSYVRRIAISGRQLVPAVNHDPVERREAVQVETSEPPVDGGGELPPPRLPLLSDGD